MSDPEREMTLDEWMGRLPHTHAAWIELESLRAEVSGYAESYDALSGECRGLRAEVTELGIRLDEANGARGIAEEENKRLRAEIERLRAERDALKAENEAYRQWYDAHAAIIDNYRVGERSE